MISLEIINTDSWKTFGPIRCQGDIDRMVVKSSAVRLVNHASVGPIGDLVSTFRPSIEAGSNSEFRAGRMCEGRSYMIQ